MIVGCLVMTNLFSGNGGRNTDNGRNGDEGAISYSPEANSPAVISEGGGGGKGMSATK